MSELEKVLIVGDGGREYALIAEAIGSGVSTVYSTREEDSINIGIESVQNMGLGGDIAAIVDFAVQKKVDLVVVGPEKPLVNGLGDMLRQKGVAVFGPNADGARFEADKTVTHAFVERHGLPNPDNSQTFTPNQAGAAKDLIRQLGPDKIYTKRVGLEGGKGAAGYGPDDLGAALAEVDAVAKKGEKLLIQGRLLGPEYSVMFMLDGTGKAVALPLSRDHKSLYNGGQGPNTGGMGAFAPLGIEQAGLKRRQEIERIGLRLAEGLVRDGIDYRGVIYLGLMAETPDPDSALRILETNVRFGDPETQILLQSLHHKALDYMYAAAQGAGEMDMSRLYLEAGKEPVSLTVCLASPGYATGDVVTGLPIHIPKDLPQDVSIQFAGAKMIGGVPTSTSGRVAYITKTAPSIAEARTVYDYIGRANGGLYIGDDQQVTRTDIGLV